MANIIVPQRRVWTRQPQGAPAVDPSIDSVLTPVGGTSALESTGGFRNVKGAPWTSPSYLNIAKSICAAGQSVYSNAALYYQRTIPMSGALTVGIVYVPVAASSGAGIWSIGGSESDGSPQILLQRNGNDLRVYSSGGFKLAFAGVAPIGAVCNIALSIDNLAARGSALKLAVNGVVKTYAGGILATGESTEYLMSGYLTGADGHYCLYWSKRALLSDAELISLTSNPWQIFYRRDHRTIVDLGGSGLSAVYADSALTYYIRSLLSSDSGIQYAIRNAIYKDDAVGYYLRSAIAQNSEVGYVLRSAIAKDDAEAYKIRGLVQSSDAEAYSIRGLVQTSDGEAYKIRSQVQADTSTSYDIQSSTSVASSNAVNYSVRGSVAASVLVGYSVRGSVQKDAASAYSVRSAVSRDVAASYAVSASASSVYADSTASYLVDGVVPSGPSAESIAAAVLAALQATTIPVNATQGAWPTATENADAVWSKTLP